LQNGTSIGTTTGALTFNVTGLTQNTSYAFTVTARDAAGNISPVSNTANVTTLTAADGQAPTAPSNLTASGTTNTTTNLAWTASTDNVAVTGYNILQNGTSVGTTTGALTFNVTGLTQNTTYAFTVTARDAAGNVSPASNTANVTTTGSGVIDYTSANSNLPTVDWTARDLFASRNVGIGTTNTQGYRLAVDGNVVAEEIKVELSQNWPDFVFTKSYGLPTLDEVEQHILDKGHLQNIPSAMEVELNGIMLGEMNAKLLQKIEELTLYAIQQEKKIMKLENENKKIQLLAEKLIELEGLIKGNN
jgi:chitodextrinase